MIADLLCPLILCNEKDASSPCYSSPKSVPQINHNEASDKPKLRDILQNI